MPSTEFSGSSANSLRVPSPLPGGSTLMVRAPRSASSIVP